MNTAQKNTGIWIDGSQAVIVTLDGDNHQVEVLEANIENRVHHQGQGKPGTYMGEHHINDEQKFEARKKAQVQSFVKEVVNKVKSAGAIFIMGPSEMKTHLRKKIEEDRLLAPRLHKVESADHMSTNQCVARVKEFYNEPIRRHNLQS